MRPQGVDTNISGQASRPVRGSDGGERRFHGRCGDVGLRQQAQGLKTMTARAHCRLRPIVGTRYLRRLRNNPSDATPLLNQRATPYKCDAAQEKSRSAFAQALARAGEHGAVVVPIVTDAGAKILIVTKGAAPPTGAEGPIAVDLPELTTNRLARLMRGDPKAAYMGGWLGNYNINYLQGETARSVLAAMARYRQRPWPRALAALWRASRRGIEEGRG
jgi:hypothetical protein